MKVYVCYLTSGRYSDTEWILSHVYDNEDEAKEWRDNKLEAFLDKVKELGIMDTVCTEAEEKGMKLAQEMGIPELCGYWTDYLVGDYKEMEVE